MVDFLCTIYVIFGLIVLPIWFIKLDRKEKDINPNIHKQLEDQKTDKLIQLTNQYTNDLLTGKISAEEYNQKYTGAIDRKVEKTAQVLINRNTNSIRAFNGTEIK